MADFLDAADLLRQGRKVGHDTESFDLTFKGLAQLRYAHSKAILDIRNIEHVFAAFEMVGLIGRLGSLEEPEVKGLGPAIRRTIVRTLESLVQFPVSEGQVHPPEPYQGFVDLIRQWDSRGLGPMSCITFNYDVALDYAFHFNAMNIDYCQAQAIPNHLQIMKLHGSLNWGRCPSCNAVVPWHLSEFFSRFNWRSLQILKISNVKHVPLEIATRLPSLAHCGTYCLPDAAIVPPTWNKMTYHQEIGMVWRHAAQNLTDVENIFVFGYSLPDTDQFFRYLYALGSISSTILKRFWVFDPDPSGSVRQRYESLLGPGARDRFRYFEEPFNKAIQTVGRELDSEGSLVGG